MGAQWKTPIKAASAAKKGALIGKLAKEIIVAAKLGGPDPTTNFRLRGAVEDARRASVPRDTIERAIKRGAGLLDDPVIYESVVYEGFAPHQVPVIVECLTDNRNRTASDVRVAFRKGQLGSSGSVAWMFDHRGVVDAQPPTANIDIEGAAIEAGADDVSLTQNEEGEKIARFLCALTDLDKVNRALTTQGWKILNSEMSYIAKTPITLGEEALKEVSDFLANLDESDDVHRIYVALRG